MEFKFPNIRHLYAVWGVAELKRVGLAAARVHLSQPAITQAIAKMEHALDFALFERRSDGMFPTELGEIFIHRVGRTLDLLKTGEVMARRAAPRQGDKGRRDFHKLTTAVQLQALIAMSRVGNFSHAARQLGVSQPAVHRAARDLEQLAGLKFFEPVRRGVILTPAAEAFVYQVRLAAAELQQGYFEVAEYRGKGTSRVRIGSLPLSRTSILPSAIHALVESGSGLQIHNVDGPYATLLRDLRFGDLDFMIGAMRDPPPADDVIQEPLFDDSLVAVTRADHPLQRRDAVTFEQTLEYPWIAPPRNTPSGTYMYEGLRIQDMRDNPVRIVSSSLVLVRGLMLRGDYVTVMSHKQIAIEEEKGVLAALPVALKGNARPIGLTFRTGWSPTPAQLQLLDLIRDQCRAFAA